MGETDERRAELWPFVCLALQLVLSNVARLSLLVIDAAFVGHLGTNELAGASLAMLWIDFPLYTVWGLANALVVLCGQAYGAKNGILMGIWLQMALVLVTLLAVPTTIYCLFLHDLLRVASDDSAILAFGARFGALLSPSMWPLLAYVCLRQYLQALGIVAPTTVNAVVAVGLDIAANYVLIHVAHLGFDGSPLATVLVAWLQPIALYLYAFVYKKHHRHAWGGWKLSELTRQRWRTFLQIALPLGLNDGCDLLATAALSLVVARISTEAIATHAILSNVWTIVDAIYYGLGLASEVGLATHLGGGRPKAARACAMRGVAVLTLAGFLVCLGLWLSPARIVGLFTDETSLLDMYMDVLPLLVAACGLRSLEVALVTTLEGLCQMRLVTFVTVGGLWGVELPLAYYCGLYLDLGLRGVWAASAIAVAFKMVFLGLRCLRIDWATMAAEAMATAEASGDSSTEVDDSSDSICLVVTPVHESSMDPVSRRLSSAERLFQLISYKSSIPSRRNNAAKALTGPERARQLWATVRDNLSVLVPPKPTTRYRRAAVPPLMFDPESDIKVKWDLALACCVLYTTAVVPYRVSFSIDATGFFFVLETAIDCAFFVDIVCSFRTGIENPSTGHVYYNKQHIAVAYLKGWFLIDFVSTVPISTVAQWMYPNLNSSALMTTRIFRGTKLIRLLKLARIRKIGVMIAKWEEEVFANQSLLSLLKILFFVFFLAHLVACVWFYAATTSTYSWASAAGYMADNHAHKQNLQYLASLYWAIVTMTTVGYGDIDPKTKVEIVIAMFVMVIGVVMFGYVIGNITALVDNLDASSRMQSERMTSVKEYIIARSIPKHIGKRILDHFEYFYRHRSVFDEDAILKNLPSVLRHEVVHHVLRKFIARIDFLSEFHEGLVSDMAVAMHPFFVVKDEGIYAQHEIAAHVFFLMKGTAVLVKAYTGQMGETQLLPLSPGMHFGEIELYHPRYGRGVRICSAISKTYCELTFLSRQVISHIGETWPEILAHFEHTGNQKIRYMAKRGPLEEFTLGIKPPSTNGLRHRRFSMSGRVLPLTRKAGMYIQPGTHSGGRRTSFDNKDMPAIEDLGTYDLSSSSEDDEIQTISSTKQLDAAVLRVQPLVRPVLNERKTAHQHWVFHPQDLFLVNWQLSVATAIMYSTIMVPYRIGFNADPSGSELMFDLFVDALFFVDIGISFRTAYYTVERQLVVNGNTIMYAYLRGWFLVDLVSTVPIDTIGSYFITARTSSQVLASTKILRVFRIARIFKLIRLLKIGKVFKRIRDSIQLSPSTERLMKLVLIMVLFGHWNGCIFHFIMLQEEDLGLRTWCTEYFFPQDDDPGLCSNRVSIVDRYLASIYWAFTTMATVGYGDIRPYRFSVAEILFAIICLLVNSTVFAYVVSGIIEVIYNYDPSAREYSSRLNAMKDYVRDASMSVRLSTNVKRHYDYLLSTVCLFPEEKIFGQLRPSLRFDVARLVSSSSIMTIGIIASMEKRYKGFVSYAMFLLKPQYVLRSERVCHSGSPGTEMYFILDGECEQLDKDNRNARVLGESAVVEAYALLARPEEHYRTESTLTVLTKSCQLYAFAVQDFRTIASISPAISSNLSYELARSIIQDDFLRLSDVQERTVAAAIEREMAHNPDATHHLGNLAQVVLTTIKVAHGDPLTLTMKEAVHKLVVNSTTHQDANNATLQSV